MAKGDGAAEVRDAQIRQLYAKGLLAYVTSLVNGGILVAVAGHQQLPFGRRALWLGILTVVTGFRIQTWRSFQARGAASTPIDRIWLVLFRIGAAKNGIVWGAAAYVLWTPAPGMFHALMGFVVGGLVAGASITAGSDLVAFACFAVPSLVPLIVRLELSGDPVDAAMGAMVALFGGAMFMLARRTQSWFLQNTILRIRNEQLIAELSRARVGLEGTVAERTVELQKTVAQLRDTEEQLRRAVRARDEFLAVAAHEIRTPLSALELQVTSVERRVERLEAVQPTDLGEGLKLVHRQVHRLADLAERVLNASGVTREPRLELNHADLVAIVRAVIDDLAGAGLPASTPITVALPETLPGKWDVVRIGQVVQNLVSNALKYGAGRSVELRLVRRDGRAVLSVRDHGPGVPEPDREHIFERFYRAGPDRDAAGLGIGLSVVRDLVTAMGGTISLSAGNGEGSTFVVDLPVQA